MSFLTKFIKLMKSEPSSKEKKKPNFSWTLDENKYLKLHEVRRLRSISKKAKVSVARQGKAMVVRDWFMIEIGLYSGLRVQEMADLKCGDLNIQSHQSSLNVRRGKGGKSRNVKLTQEFKRECRWFLKWKKKIGQSIDPESPLLTTRKGKQLCKRTLQKAFKKCAHKAGLRKRYSVHSLRHTHGAHLYVVSGHNLRLVQEQLGHSSVRVTEIYASLMDRDVRDAVEKLYR